MKHVLLILAFLVMTQFCSLAQWIYDPDNPQVVSNEINVQRNVQQVQDGNGGTFVFWIDGKINPNSADIYGQHYDASGYELWESNGRQIINHYSPVVSFSVVRSNYDGEMIIGIRTASEIFQDSLRFQKLNDEGEKLWVEDLLVAKTDGCTGNYFLNLLDFQFFRNESGNYTVNVVPVYCGGTNGCRITHFNSEGVLTGLFGGEPEGNQWSIGINGIDKTYDGTNDTYVFYTDGSAAGAHAYVMRVSLAGDYVFAPVDVLESTNGLNSKFAALSDENGVVVCYESTGANGNVDLFMRKLNSDGTWAWNGDIIELCTAAGNQTKFYLVQDNDFYYVVWADGRPGVVGNAAIYAQKVDKSNGATIWETDGIEVFDQPTYIPYPKCVLTDDGELIVTNEATGDFGFNAQMVNPDGTLNWPVTTMLANIQYSPFYEEYSLIKSNENIIVAWCRTNPVGGADGVYIANVLETDLTTYLYESVTACNSYTVNGQTFTQSGEYEIELPGDTLLTLNLTLYSVEAIANLQGEILVAENSEGQFSWVNCDSGQVVATGTNTFVPSETGNYAFIVEVNGCVDTSACIHVQVMRVNEFFPNQTYTVYPNPVKHFFRIHNLKEKSRVELFDLGGKCVMSCVVNVNDFINVEKTVSPGIYFARVMSQNECCLLQLMIE